MSELAEERTIMVYHPHALSFEEHKTFDGTVITILEIIEPKNIEFSTKFRSSVDVSRLVSRGDLVCKVNEEYIEPNTRFADFEKFLDAEFKKAKNKPVSITVLKTSFKKHGKLRQAETVKNALKWKEEQEGIRYAIETYKTYIIPKNYKLHTARYKNPRNVLKRRLDSIYVQLLIFLLIMTDLSIFAVAEATKNDVTKEWHHIIFLMTFAILGVYVTEIVLRIYAMRPEIFFKDPLEVLDLIVVIASLILNLVEYVDAALFVRAARSLRAFRVLRIFRSFRLCVRTTKTLRNAPKSIRQVVRLNKQGIYEYIVYLNILYKY